MSDDPHAGHDGTLDYHRRMVGDVHRVDAYERALRRLVRPGDVVLDLGAGTGLLAMVAARRGARVHAVESMSVAAVAQRLVHDNGLADRVRVHHADVRALAPAEPVDLIVSDFMGRFVADDSMLEAMRAALRWLKPGGRVCPARVALRLAPIALAAFAPVDAFLAPVAGLSLDALAAVALDWTYPVSLSPDAVLAPPALHALIHPGDGPDAFGGRHTFAVAKAGVLRGFAGWFDAELAPDVLLSTAPGIETHWDQLLFPTEAVAVASGDVVEVALELEEGESGVYLWRWSGTVRRAGHPPLPFAHQSIGRLESGAPRPWAALDVDALDALNERGSAAFATGDYAAAADAFTAAVRGLGPEHDDIAPLIWENLGLALVLDERPGAALGPLLRALDGDLAGREQSARYLVHAALGAGRHLDAERFRDAYEARFGPHPSRHDP